MSVIIPDGFVNCPVCDTKHVPTKGTLEDGVYAGTCDGCGHFFKFKAIPEDRSHVKVTINGTTYTVDNSYDPATSLNDFLRSKRVSMGTKYMCREGGCGICVVMATRENPASGAKESYAINSCLCPVFMCDGWEIVTVEGIGNTRDGLHPIQKALNDHNGSQCGFCSPAQVMNMYALMQNNPKPSKQTVEDAFDGILCRCTGYRSILDAMKSLASSDTKKDCSSTDIEDLCNKMCVKDPSKPCPGSCDEDRPVKMVLRDSVWHKPRSLKQLYHLLREYSGKEIRLMFGGTGSGVYKDIGPWMYNVIIDLHGVQDLYTVTVGPAVMIGACVTLTQMMDLFNQVKPGGLPYLRECAEFLKRIAHTNVRNAGSWAGNLMMKHKHWEFVSDVFVMLETVKAQIYIDSTVAVSAASLLETDMTGKVLTHMVLPPSPTSSLTKFYKVTKRAQNCHSHVSAGFQMVIDPADNYLIREQPSIVYAGISATFVHATATEKYLTNKKLLDKDVLKGALSTLKSELKPDADPLNGSTKFRQDLAVNLLFRYLVHVLGKHGPPQWQSAGDPLERPLSSGIQSYDTKKQEWPLTEPMTKLEGKAQVTGEAVYINDITPAPGELCAAYAVTTVGNATIASIDTSAALELHGVVKVILAADIPGQNNAMPAPYAPEEMLCSGKVMYAGQAVAIVVADNEETAYTASKMIKITYTKVAPPVLTIAEAVSKGMVFPAVTKDIVVGDADGAISKSKHALSGSIHCGTQSHFSFETQIALCVPQEDGMKVYASSQWIDYAQKSVAQVLDVSVASVDVEVKRLGGAYGAKISRNFAIASSCAVAAKLLNRPVRFAMNFHTNMENVGRRFPYLANYKVGFTDEGKLNGVHVTYYCDCGSSVNDCTVDDIIHMGDNAYYCPNWHMSQQAVQTNTPSNTYCRAPGSTPGIFVMETIMEHVAKSLGKDPTQIRELNLYKKDQKTPGGMTLTYCSISNLVKSLTTSAELQTRLKAVVDYNKANRWKKRGISVVPMKYGAPWNTQNYGVNLAVYSADGTVAISHGGIEVGQAINTKVAQVCAYEFGIPVDTIKIKPTNTLTAAGSCFTGSSVTSELVCQSVVNACQELLKRMAPVKAKLHNPTWLDVAKACYAEGVDLAVHGWYRPHTDYKYRYNSYGVTCTEVELDVLTGEHQIARVDMLFDCGESMNPSIDIGQVEGAFVMGLGYWLLEESIYNTETGEYLTNSTWDYKPPSSKDIPIDFRIQLLKDAPNPLGILRSKLVGEPPLCMSCSALFALKHAVEEARKDAGQTEYFPLNGPATVEVLQQSCLSDLTQHLQ